MSTTTTEPGLDADDDPAIRYSKVLRPHRSSTNKALRILSVFLVLFFLTAGLGFLMAGAWPVFGIMGLEIGGLIFALWYNHKVGSSFEAITITEQEFRLSKVDHWGKRRHWTFQPQWLKVRFEPVSKQLICGVHGKHVIIGKFLTEDEREMLAETLHAEVQRLQLPTHLHAGA